MSGEIAKAVSNTVVFYVGLGDQFDDDRRLVREGNIRHSGHYLPPGLRKDSGDLGETSAPTVSTMRDPRRSAANSEAKDVDMSTIDTRMLAGTPIPATPIVERAIELARQKCEPYLFNHVMRSWLFAVRIGQLKGIAHDPEVVALATLLTMLRSTKASLGRAALK